MALLNIWELSRRNIHLLKKLGEGNFGKVFKAEVTTPSGATRVVAVKSLKGALYFVLMNAFFVAMKQLFLYKV